MLLLRKHNITYPLLSQYPIYLNLLVDLMVQERLAPEKKNLFIFELIFKTTVKKVWNN